MKPGTLVAVCKNGEVFITTTATESYVLDKPMGVWKNYKGQEVVHLHGFRGFHAISHILAITGKNIHSSAIMALGHLCCHLKPILHQHNTDISEFNRKAAAEDN